MVYKKKKKRIKKGQNIENLSNFKLDCPNCYKYSLVPSQRIVVPKVNNGLNLCFNFRRNA